MKIINTTYRIISLSILIGLLSIVSHDLVAHNHSEHSHNYGTEQQYESNVQDAHCFLCDFHKTNKFLSVDFSSEFSAFQTKLKQNLPNDCRLFNGHKCQNSGRSPPTLESL